MKYNTFSVEELIRQQIIEKPLDGNHGGVHPKSSDFVSTGIPFIMATDINNGSIDFSNCNYISLEQAETLKKGKAKVGDVLITHKATIGRTGIVPFMEYPYIVLSPQVTYYRIKDTTKLNPYYLKYYFDSVNFQNLLMNWAASGSTRSYIGITAQLKLPIILPDIEFQTSIFNAISPINELLNINEKKIKVLENISSCLFKHWFIDFEFPNEEGQPYKSSGGKMIESELGMIPAEWVISSIDTLTTDILDHRGKTPKKLGGDWALQGYPAISAKNIKNNNIVREDDIRYLTKEMYHKWMKKELEYGDIVMTSEAPLGELYFVNEGEKYSLSQRLFAIRISKDYFIPSVFFSLLNHTKYKELILNRATGTTVTGIRQNELRKVRTIVPPMKIQEKIAGILGNSLNQQFTIRKENRNLKNLRDILLPKLLSGEIEVLVEAESSLL